MQIWSLWWSILSGLRKACSRKASFLWLAATCAGFCVRSDGLGVTSIVRALGLAQHYYDRLLDFFHSSAVNPDVLARTWVRVVLGRLPQQGFRVNNRLVILGDGIKVQKSGKKMPAVKLLHQHSENNTKPKYIMGHSVQVASLLTRAGAGFVAIPLAGRIHEGLVYSNRDQRTLPGKLVTLVESLHIAEPFYFVADAYYACQKVARDLTHAGQHLISRLRKNTVAYETVVTTDHPRRRGRPRLYGKKVRLFSLFDDPDYAGLWQNAKSPVYDDNNVDIRFLCCDLVWRPIHRVVRFVLCDHPTRGRVAFLCTDLSTDPLDVIRLYGLRFKIELSFKQALRIVSAYAYHFWMTAWKKTARGAGDCHLHRESDDYRNAVRRKIDAYHRHIQVGLISQGILQLIAILAPRLVWQNFGSWLRTVRPGLPPSELVVQTALRNSLPDFLAHSHSAVIFKKFLRPKLDLSQAVLFRLTG